MNMNVEDITPLYFNLHGFRSIFYKKIDNTIYKSGTSILLLDEEEFFDNKRNKEIIISKELLNIEPDPDQGDFIFINKFMYRIDYVEKIKDGYFRCTINKLVSHETIYNQ